jgi:hypothetical protein
MTIADCSAPVQIKRGYADGDVGVGRPHVRGNDDAGGDGGDLHDE